MEDVDDRYRVPAEFEKQGSVLMMWPLRIRCSGGRVLDRDAVATDLVKNLTRHVRTIVSCYDEELKAHAQHCLREAGVDLSNIEFILYPCKIFYPRDFGAQIMIDDEGRRLHVSFASTAYGSVPYGSPLARRMEEFGQVHARHLGVTATRFSRMVSEGGDREFNGRGVMIATEDTEVRKRNPGWSKEEVEDEMKRIFNLQKVIWIPRASYSDECVYSGPIPDATNLMRAYRAASADGHADTMCRFISEDTVMLAHVSELEAARSELHRLNKERLDEAEAVLKQSSTADGSPLKVIRMPTPEPVYVDLAPDDYLYYIFRSGAQQYDGRMWDGSPFPSGAIRVMPAMSYCNFLITNGLVIGQKYYREGMSSLVQQKDLEAERLLHEAFPDREIVLIDSLALNMHGGGIHCNTRNAP